VAGFANKAAASISSHFTKSWYQPYNTKKINKKEWLRNIGAFLKYSK